MNYQLEMEKVIKETEKGKKLFLHCCCAPCSTAVLERLSDHFEITVYYYNPNIMEQAEYEKRMEELKRFAEVFPSTYPIHFQKEEYDPSPFLKKVKGLEQELEGGKRCYLCYQLRLEETARMAKKNGFDYFTTTLSISPYKNVLWLNEIGQFYGTQYQVSYLPADFKKKNGYLRSTELAKQYQLYRQDYCGCFFSKQERDHQKIGRSI